MPDLPEKYYYLPHEFGDLFDSSDAQAAGTAGFGGISSSPDAIMRLFHGQDPTVNAIVDVMRRDRLLSAFPSVEDGAKLLERVLPEFVKQFDHGDQLHLPTMESDVHAVLDSDKEGLFNQLLFDFFTSEMDQIEAGGQETVYIFVDQPPPEQSYEYIGEKLARLLRRRNHNDTDPKTQAFFGWIGRMLMKQICPETDFSLDRHEVRVAKEKAEIADAFAAFRKRLNEGVEGNLTEDKAKAFFKELNDFADALPSMIGGDTPLRLRVGRNLGMNFNGGEDLDDYLPYKYDTPRIFHDNTFAKFMEDWQSAPREGQFPYNFRQSYKKLHPEIFGDIPEDDTAARQLSEEVLLPKWFTMLTTILSEETEWIAKDAEDFTVTYFRFIHNKDVAAGYAFAEQHRDEILANLSQVLHMTEAEVKARFMQGDPKILYDENDFGENTLDDSYSDVDFEETSMPIFNEQSDPPAIVLSEKEKARSDEDWLRIIGSGPNAALYEELEKYQIFSDEDWFFGVHPLFFGNWLSDREAYLVDKKEEAGIFYASRREMTPIERERERIEELKAGIFSLPNTLEDLVTNATRQIKRLEQEYGQWREKATTFNVEAIRQASFLQERMIAIRRVRNSIQGMIANQAK